MSAPAPGVRPARARPEPRPAPELPAAGRPDASGQVTVLCRDGRRITLTEREAEVVGLVADGLTNREIGARLYLSPSTVAMHLQRIYRRLEVSGRAELVARLAAVPPPVPAAPAAGVVNGRVRVPGPLLSERQRRVTELIVQGLTNPEIGARLGITSVDTVKSLVSSVLGKFGARNRAELAGRMAEAGARQRTGAVVALIGELRATSLDGAQRALLDKLAELVGGARS